MGTEEFDLTPEEEAAFDAQQQPEEQEEPTDGGQEAEQESAEPQDGEEAEKDVSSEQDKSKPPKGHVPLEALHEERQKRQQLQSELQQTQTRVEQLAQLEQEMREHRERARQQQEQYDSEKAYQDDPVGFLRQQNEKLQQRLQQWEQGIQEQQQTYQQQQQHNQQIQQLAQEVRSQEETFRQQAPDYDDAFNYVQQAAMEDYDLYGVTDPVQKQQQFYQQVMAVSLQALQAGKNPAEVVYQIAQRRGYQGKGQGANKASEKVETAKRGQKATTTLSEGGGGSPHESGVSMSDIERMSDDEFDKFWDEMRKDSKSGR